YQVSDRQQDVAVNVLLIAVICVNRSLHEPMFLLLCSLLVNELYGSSGLLPFLLVQILSDVHIVSAPLCFLQIFCLYSYVNTEFCNLAVMSYDRYLAICCPLQYHAVMTHHKVIFVIILTWLYSFVKFLITLLLTVRLTLCGNVLNSTFCRNYLVVNLACSDTSVNNIYGLFGTVITVLVPLLPILYSYTKILSVVLSGSKQTRQKAVNTCMPHLASLLRFDMVSVPNGLQIVMSLYFVILQSLLNPIMYGITLTKIRNACKQLFSNKPLITET
ncbi:putative gustatory receptor clone PTE03, partial [Poecilia latipinna]|uniref:putative gustatory receptor clone PTE03 n=1 Tax=Poecilia latipinna TaxID=48699 RepID=UPI00072E0ECC